MARLARAMTWKFAVWRVPYAGAKAGVRFAGGAREEVLAAYKRALEPYSGVFLTGPDMGTFLADFADGVADGPLPLWAQSHEGVDMDDLATGHGVKAAAEAALAHTGRTLAGAAIAIEGFGKVGAGMALASARAGARIVGVSTVDGLLADAGGLNIDELFSLREQHGDALVAHGAVARPPARGAVRLGLRRARARRAAGLDHARRGQAAALRGRRPRARTSPTAPAPSRSCIAVGSSPSPTSSPTPAASISTRVSARTTPRRRRWPGSRR